MTHIVSWNINSIRVRTKLVEQLFGTDDVVQVGEAFAILETEGEEDNNEKNIVEENINDQKEVEEELLVQALQELEVVQHL